MPRLVGVDPLLGQQLAALVLARRVADLGRPAADQRDRPVAGALQVAQQHDADEIADVQAVGRAVEPDIARDDARPPPARRAPPASVHWWM